MNPALLSAFLLPVESVSPVDSITGSFVGYVASLGLAGIGLLVMFWLYIAPGKLTKQAREDARADLLAENERLRADSTRLAAERDEALRTATDRLLPMLASFTATTGALIPLLQRLITDRERGLLPR